MSLGQWSTTAANNATADPNINWQEGQPPSTVNDSARAMMAALATWFQSAEWINPALTPTYVSATSFTVTGNQTSVYTVGRRVRTFNTGGTLFGTITASVYTSLTTVTVQMDAGSLDSGLSEVDVSIQNPANTSLPTGLSPTFAKITSTAGIQASGLIIGADTPPVPVGNNQGSFHVWNEVPGSGATSLINNEGFGAGGFVFRNVNLANTIETGRVTFDGSGNVTATGTISGSSDERLKKDWESLPSDFIERLSAVKSGSFTRISNGQRSVGVGAQSLQSLLPEGVLEGPDGFLSVAYGNVALAACIELAKEVMRLRELLEQRS